MDRKVYQTRSVYVFEADFAPYRVVDVYLWLMYHRWYSAKFYYNDGACCVETDDEDALKRAVAETSPELGDARWSPNDPYKERP